jgi:hypothetical protein
MRVWMRLVYTRRCKKYTSACTLTCMHHSCLNTFAYHIIHIHASIYTYMHTDHTHHTDRTFKRYMYKNIHKYIRIYIYKYIRISIHIHTRINTCILRTCTKIHAYANITCVCKQIHTYIPKSNMYIHYVLSTYIYQNTQQKFTLYRL